MGIRVLLALVVAAVGFSLLPATAPAAAQTCGGVQISVITHGNIDTPYPVVGGGTMRFRGVEAHVSWLAHHRLAFDDAGNGTFLGLYHSFLVLSGPFAWTWFEGGGALLHPVPFTAESFPIDPYRERVEVMNGATGALMTVGRSWLQGNHPGELEFRGHICFP